MGPVGLPPRALRCCRRAARAMSEKEAEARLLALAEKIKATLTSELRVELEACKDELRAERDKEEAAMVKPDQDAAPKPKEEVRVEVAAGTRTSGDVSPQKETGTRRVSTLSYVPAILPTVPAMPTISAPELHTQLTQERPLKATLLFWSRRKTWDSPRPRLSCC